MNDSAYVLKAFTSMAGATFATRLFPFLLPRRHRSNELLRYIGKYLPPAVMLLLVVYCVKDAPFVVAPYGIPELLSIGLVVAVHAWKRNSLLSIGLGTGCYVVLRG